MKPRENLRGKKVGYLEDDFFGGKEQAYARDQV